MNKFHLIFRFFLLAAVIDMKKIILNAIINCLILQKKPLCNNYVTKLSSNIYNDITKFNNLQ